jgi:hypothetical protein
MIQPDLWVSRAGEQVALSIAAKMFYSCRELTLLHIMTRSMKL